MSQRLIMVEQKLFRVHIFSGASPPNPMEGTEWEKKIRYNLGKAGSVAMFNNQVWHRGGPNQSQHTRYITQIT